MRTPRHYTTSSGADRWAVRYRDDDRRQSTQTFEDEDVAWRFAELMDRFDWKRALAILEHEAGDGHGVPTLDEWFERWNRSRTGIEDDTRTEDAGMYARRWSPDLGQLPLDLIDRELIGDAINKRFTDAADKTVRNYHGLLSAALNAAVAAGYIPRNPTFKRRLPRRTEHELEDMTFLTPDEFWLLYAKMPEHWRPLVVTLVGTGIRWGEAEALTVGDVDLDHATLRITKAAKGKTRTIGPPKTKKSRRTVDLPPQVVDVLAPLLDRPAGARLFTAPRGGPIRHRTFWSNIWRPAIFRAGHCAKHTDDDCRCGSTHPKYCKIHDESPPPCGCRGTLTKTPRIHDLRHAHVSWLIAQGIRLEVIQDRLGHESITTTRDRHGHLLPDLRTAAAEAAGVALAPISARPKAISR